MSSSASLPPSANGKAWTEGVERAVLGNGLTVLAAHDPDAPAVAVVTHVRAGFFDEPDRWQGISHVLEHMFFKGTPTRGVGQIAAETKALGGYLNAGTAYDWTHYYVVLPADGFERALAIQADALQHASLDAEELKRELVVIIEEAKRKLDSPSALAYETLHEVLFDEHRIRRWRIGTEAGLSAFTRDDVVGYYRSRYVPSRTVVAVVGAVPAARAIAAVKSAFETWPAREGHLDPSPSEPWRSGVRVRTLRGDVKQSTLLFGWRGVPQGHPDAAVLDVAAMVLSSGRGGWLYRTLRRPGLVTSASAYHYSPSEVGVFTIGADLAPERIDEVGGVIAGLTARLCDHGPSPADLERAKTLFTSQMARRMESVDGRASAFALAEATGGLAELDREYRRILDVTAAEVRDAARRYLGPDSVASVVYLPDTVGADLSAESVAAQFASAAPLPIVEPEPAPPARLAAPRPVQGRREAGILHVPLAGIDLLLLRKATVPVVTLGVYRLREAERAPERAGLAALAVRSLARGTVGLDAGALAAGFERLGGTLGTSVAADWFGAGTAVLARHRGDAVRLLADALFAPRFDADEVGRERATLVDEVTQAGDDMFRRPIDLALSGAFGDAGYGLPLKGTPDSLARLGGADAAAWHREATAFGRPALVAVGRLDPEEAASEFAGLLGDLAVARPAPRPMAVAWTAADPLRVETRAKAQTALAMIFPGPSRNDPDRFAAEVLAAVASGLGGRLFHALRDQRSLAYTVLMSSWQRLGAGAIVTYIATSPAREDEARSAMLEELARFAGELVTAEELDRAINYLAGQAMVQRQTAGSVAAEVVDCWLIGDGLAEFADPAEPYRAVTREAVREVAARYLHPDRRSEGVVRGGAK
ncbi:MAG: M16 family metallopeptidase [Gemmatimonadales bacterium]